jgi:carbon-monoxide dehydrogenase medium subunit
MGLPGPNEETREPMQYFEPNFLDEALVLLERFGSKARILAGGTRVGPRLRQDPSGVSALVNVKRIDDLCTIAVSSTTLRIGALVTAATLRKDAGVREHAPVLAAAAASLGARQLQFVATLGGNVCSGDPASDLSVALLACDARCQVKSASEGLTTIPIERVLAQRNPVLQTGELLVAVEIPIAPHASAYEKMTTRRGFEMALVAVALCARVDGDRIVAARIGLAGAAATPIRAAHAEARLAGERISEEVAREAGRIAAESDAQDAGDRRAGDPYRRQLVATLTQRAVLSAVRHPVGGVR